MKNDLAVILASIIAGGIYMACTPDVVDSQPQGSGGVAHGCSTSCTAFCGCHTSCTTAGCDDFSCGTAAITTTTSCGTVQTTTIHTETGGSSCATIPSP